MPLGEKNKDRGLPAATGGKAMVAMVAGPNLQPPPHFDFENPAAWQRWRQQFDDYSFATGLHAADDEVRVRTLLYCMGTRSRDILCSLQVRDEDYSKYSVIRSTAASWTDTSYAPPTNCTRAHGSTDVFNRKARQRTRSSRNWEIW